MQNDSKAWSISILIQLIADRDHNGYLSFNEITQLVAELNINMPKASVKAIFQKVDIDNSGQLSIDEFTDFIALLRERFVQLFLRNFHINNILFLADLIRIYRHVKIFVFSIYLYCRCS